MARKTAMGKEPGNVSIALPKSEKERFQPGKPGMIDAITGGMKQGGKEQLKRLSPGVYRNNMGQLVGSKGQSLPGQPSLKQRALNAANQALNPNQQQPVSDQNQDMVQQIMQNAQRQQPGVQTPGSFDEMMQGFQQTPEMRRALEGIMNQGRIDGTFNPQTMQQITQGVMPGLQSGMLNYPGGRPMPENDLMYRYPAGQTPNTQALLNYGQQQQQQQPNSVSGLLQRRFR
jgi:hypothetical protein